VSVTAVALRNARQDALNLAILELTAAIFLTYMAISLALPVIPLHVHYTLGFGNFVVGASFGIDFPATVLTRGYTGVSPTAGVPLRSLNRLKKAEGVP
jgi:hypothetical protein